MESPASREQLDTDPESIFGNAVVSNDREEDEIPAFSTFSATKSGKKEKKGKKNKSTIISCINSSLQNNGPSESWPAVFDSILAAPILVGHTKPSYSDYLTSRMVAVVVSSGKTYHIHSSLLCRESERFYKSLNSEHTEATQLKIDLIDETAHQFRHFIDFLYELDWKPKTTSSIRLAELYALGERLVAPRFQDIILQVFREGSDIRAINLSQLCQLSGFACSNITERFHPRDDPMRDVIFWLVSTRIAELQKTEEFRQVLIEHAELGTQLILRAGNGTQAMPA
ncbi:hypothetical protein FKW77_010075 [Venturia effusa]|uniref:BTB domain-containing protein n=1 Tax=Venturia effusa TaxID=50376 RepID=A0A517L8A0_9PEZI|nr:hypothetical protein FKW77_010075 [Venturia effusa]